MEGKSPNHRPEIRTQILCLRFLGPKIVGTKSFVTNVWQNAAEYLELHPTIGFFINTSRIGMNKYVKFWVFTNNFAINKVAKWQVQKIISKYIKPEVVPVKIKSMFMEFSFPSFLRF